MSRARRKSKTTRQLTAKQIAAQLSKQKQQRKLKRQLQAAQSAKRSFRVQKSDKGQLIFIGVKGQRNPQAKGRKGYLIYVTKSGKKQLVKPKKTVEPYKPRKITDVAYPFQKKFRIAQRDFELARLEKTAAGKTVVKGQGNVKPSGPFDFSDDVVTKIARSIKRTIEGQRSKRSFLVQAMVLVEKSDGTTTVYEVNVPIAKADHIAIELGGIFNFVRQKFYAYMARELAYDGYVTSGSANHIRRLGLNKGKEQSEWEQPDGNRWRGNESEIVRIRSIEWRILQAK